MIVLHFLPQLAHVFLLCTLSASPSASSQLYHGKMALQISFNVQFNCQGKDALFRPLEYVSCFNKKKSFQPKYVESQEKKSIL